MPAAQKGPVTIMRKILMLLALIIGLIIIDQVSKNVIQSRFHHGESLEVIKGFFSITYVRNPGAAFGFMAMQKIRFANLYSF